VLAALVRALIPEYCADVPAPGGNQLQHCLIACCYLLCCGCGMCADETADVVVTVTAVLGAAFGVGVPPWFSVEAIMSANIRLQLAFLSSLFRVAPGLDYEFASGTLESEVPLSSKGLGFDNAPLHGTWLFGIGFTEPGIFEQDLLQLPLLLYRNRQELLHHRVSVGFFFFLSINCEFPWCHSDLLQLAGLGRAVKHPSQASPAFSLMLGIWLTLKLILRCLSKRRGVT
jgi:hypothetical protein